MHSGARRFAEEGWKAVEYDQGKQINLTSPDGALTLLWWPSSGTWMTYARSFKATPQQVLAAWQAGRFKEHGCDAATCKRCGLPIVWCKTAKGKPMPCDLDGNPHFKTCEEGQRRNGEQKENKDWQEVEEHAPGFKREVAALMEFLEWANPTRERVVVRK